MLSNFVSFKNPIRKTSDKVHREDNTKEVKTQTFYQVQTFSDVRFQFAEFVKNKQELIVSLKRLIHSIILSDPNLEKRSYEQALRLALYTIQRQMNCGETSLYTDTSILKSKKAQFLFHQIAEGNEGKFATIKSQIEILCTPEGQNHHRFLNFINTNFTKEAEEIYNFIPKALNMYYFDKNLNKVLRLNHTEKIQGLSVRSNFGFPSVYARNNFYEPITKATKINAPKFWGPSKELDDGVHSGAWIIEVPPKDVDKIWDLVKKGLEEGNVFYEAQCTLVEGNTKAGFTERHHIMVFAADYLDSTLICATYAELVRLKIIEQGEDLSFRRKIEINQNLTETMFTFKTMKTELANRISKLKDI